jgi:hypothetical protein
VRKRLKYCVLLWCFEALAQNERFEFPAEQRTGTTFSFGGGMGAFMQSALP